VTFKSTFTRIALLTCGITYEMTLLVSELFSVQPEQVQSLLFSHTVNAALILCSFCVRTFVNNCVPRIGLVLQCNNYTVLHISLVRLLVFSNIISCSLYCI